MNSLSGVLPKKKTAATASPDHDFVVVGAGIAGAAVARTLVDLGLRVLVVSAGKGASHAPVAILNPVRAQRGKAIPDAAETLAVARSLYGRFARLHFGLEHVVPPEAVPKWQANLKDAGIETVWRGHRLFLPQAFWMHPRTLIPALLRNIPRIHDRVVAWFQEGLWLQSGRFLKGPVIWAAGAEGTEVTGLEGRLVAGTLLLTKEPGHGVIQGVFYVGGALGGTHRPVPRFLAHTPTHDEIEELRTRARAILGYPPTPIGAFTGVRYLKDQVLREVPGGFLFTGFGSTGHLRAPIWARRLARTIL